MFKDVLNNKFLDSVNQLVNFIILNCLFLITCLPVFTIGAALSALYSVMLREARQEYGYLIRPYFREFRRNLASGTKLFAVLALIGLALSGSTFYWFRTGTSWSRALAVVQIFLLLFWRQVWLFAFPINARFENTTKGTLKSAVNLIFLNIKKSLFLLGTDALIIALLVFVKELDAFMVLAGFVITAYFRSTVFVKLFAPYEVSPENT